jgi:hypothetical protein
MPVATARHVPRRTRHWLAFQTIRLNLAACQKDGEFPENRSLAALK